MCNVQWFSHSSFKLIPFISINSNSNDAEASAAVVPYLFVPYIIIQSVYIYIVMFVWLVEINLTNNVTVVHCFDGIDKWTQDIQCFIACLLLGCIDSILPKSRRFITDSWIWIILLVWGVLFRLREKYTAVKWYDLIYKYFLYKICHNHSRNNKKALNFQIAQIVNQLWNLLVK